MARVLELLRESGSPSKAYDLIARYAPSGRLPAPPTVYRALAKLVEQGLVHRVFTLDAYVACTLQGVEHRPAFFVCDGCGFFQELSGDAAVAAMAHLEASIQSLVLEVHGRCGACEA